MKTIILSTLLGLCAACLAASAQTLPQDKTVDVAAHSLCIDVPDQPRFMPREIALRKDFC